MPSRYEELFDRYHAIASTKQGTKYELLAAMIAKSLEQHNKVIHDIKMRGDSDVKHQIDVSIEEPDKNRRILIECKDFDESGDKVGLAIVRDFSAVVSDTAPDEAWIITCNGYTSDALKFAKAKNILPIIVRLFTEQDGAGRIKKIIVNFVVRVPINPTAKLYINDVDAELIETAKQVAGIKKGVHANDDVYFMTPEGGKIHFNEFIADQMNKAMGERIDGEARAIIHPEDRTLLIGGAAVPYKGIVVDFGPD